MGGLCSKELEFTPVKYTIHVTTNDSYKNAGSNSCVFIDMIGEENGVSSGWIPLDNILRNDFERGRKNKFTIKTKDVGIPLIIRLELRHRHKMDRWACDEVTVLLDDTEVAFPVYDWVDDEIWFTRGKALAYHHLTNKALEGMRRREVESSKVKFQWVARPNVGDVGWGLPRYAEESNGSDLPKIFQATEDRTKTIISKGIEAIVNVALQKITNAFSKLDDLEDFKRLYKFLQEDEDPPFIDTWKSDIEFGRQQLMGITPTSISKCYNLPEGCQISHSHVYDILCNGLSLEQEMKAGRIFIGDYSRVFQGVKRNKNASGEQLYCPDAICIYYVNPDHNLIPIAIQLVPNDEDTIFTPKDTTDDWLLAKMYFKNAMANVHEWYYHFLLTHNVMEPFAVSLFRCFPRSHPIYKLLRPHLQTVSAINSLARTSLIAAGTTANQSLSIEGEDLARHMYKTFKLDDLIIPEVLKKRGLDDKEILPRNYYRDDALGLWYIIEEFVRSIVHHYYETDQQVLDDGDVQSFAKDMADEGLGWESEDTKGMKSSIDDRKYLICLCTSVIFTSSVQHASVNFPQYEMYKFIPNFPFGMRLPPHKRGEATEERIIKSLPNLNMSVIGITIAYTLSSYSPDEVYLGEYPMKLFTDPEELKLLDNYRSALKTFSDKVKERNKTAGAGAYDVLLPEKVPNSIAI